MVPDYQENEMSQASTLKNRSKCLPLAQTIIFILLNSVLLLNSIAYIILSIVFLNKYDNLLLAPVTGLVAFALILYLIIFLTTLLGCYGFHNKDFTTLFVQALLLFLIFILQIVGVFFVQTLAGNIDSDDGFIRVIGELDASFDAQVFNDCCITFLDNVQVDPIEIVGASLGDIVNDNLCQKLVDLEDRSFVGNDLDESCGGEDNDFAQFQEDFSGFTAHFFETFGSFQWLSDALTLLSLLNTVFLLCCVASDEDDISTYHHNVQLHQEKADAKSPDEVMYPLEYAPQRKLTIPRSMKFTQGQKNTFHRFSNKMRSWRPSQRDVSAELPNDAPPVPPPKVRAFRSTFARMSSGMKKSWDKAGMRMSPQGRQDDDVLKPSKRRKKVRRRRNTKNKEGVAEFPADANFGNSPQILTPRLNPNVKDSYADFSNADPNVLDPSPSYMTSEL